MTKAEMKRIQAELNRRGYGPLDVDGDYGPLSKKAVQAFQRASGINPSGTIGPLTTAALFPATDLRLPALPWIELARTMIGLHEVRDNAELRKFLISDGGTVGDPAKIAWCGDFVHTCMRKTLPAEPSWPQNPYAAVNWSKWAEHVEPQYGCVLSFHRGNPENWQGHVAWYISEDNSYYHCLGSNQNNGINIAKIAKSKLRKNGSRWPVTGPRPTGLVVRGNGSQIITANSVA